MRLIRRILSVLLCALVLGAVSRQAAGDNAQRRAGADALFREAVVLADAGKFEEAIQKFGASYELDPARGTLQGLAMAEERAGRVLDAMTHFRKLLELAQRADDQARVDVAKEHLDALRIRIPSLTVAFANDVPAGTTVTIDEEKLPAGAIGSALPINPGDHRLVAESPDGRTFARVIGVSEGARTKIVVTFEKPTRAATPPPAVAPLAERKPEERDHESRPPDLRTVGLVVGGAGLVVTGIGAYLYLEAGRDYDSLTETCENKVCTPDQQDRIERGRTKENWGRIALIAGGLGMAAGVTLFVIGSRNEQSPAVEGAIGPSGAVVRGRF